MKRVVIHSRRVLFSSRMEGGIQVLDRETVFGYVRRAVLHSIRKSEDPLAFMLFDARDLNQQDMSFGESWWKFADLHAFYTDLDWDDYMLNAEDACNKSGYACELRSISVDPPISSGEERWRRVRPIA